MNFRRMMKYILSVITLCCTGISGFTQVIDCASPSAYKQLPASWKQAGDVQADLSSNNVLIVQNGSGILVNTSTDKKHGTDIMTSFEHGDADIEFDYLLARGANSGIYLQGRYEVQLFDSWGKPQASSSDNGGIYERWNEDKPEGQKGYGGIAPRQNVSRAPGVWQHMRISFTAPTFDASGKKTSNARINKVELNGVTIHDNVELFGGTRGALEKEQAKGPLRIQGDHGSVAFRNFKLFAYDKERPELVNLNYQVFKGIYNKEPDYKSLSPEAQGSQPILTAKISNLPDTFLMRYTGTIKIKESGDYRFNVSTAGGKGTLRINNKPVATITEQDKNAITPLQAGEYPFEMVFTKVQDWGNANLVVRVSGPGIREFILSDADDMPNESTDPILIPATSNTLLRSFMDIPGKRVIHAVSVGSAANIHYTYDMDCGALVQVWRGGFLDATPMWHERGDGSSRPTGTIQLLGDPQPLLSRLSKTDEPWKKDTTGTGFRSKGYKLDKTERPMFRYLMYGSMVTDNILVAENNSGFIREIQVTNAPPDLYVRLANNDKIEKAGEGIYLIGNHEYFIQVDESAGVILRNSGNKKELIVPIKTKIVYSLLF